MSFTNNTKDRWGIGVVFVVSAIGGTVAMIMGPDDAMLEFATIFSVGPGLFVLMTSAWILYRLLSNRQPH